MVRLLSWKSEDSITDKKDASLYSVTSETAKSSTDDILSSAAPPDNNKMVTCSERNDGDNPPIGTRWSIHKNLVLISVGFMLLFTSYKALANIQSSLNSVDGLGVVSLSATYAALVFSALLLPSYIIDKLGCKTALFVSMAFYVPYMVANFYATFYTLIPTALLVGLGGANLWSAKCSYLSKIGTDYAQLTGTTPSVSIARFFGLFFMAYQSSQIFGNLISSFVLKPPDDQNITLISQQQLDICGVEYLNQKLPFDEFPIGQNGTTDLNSETVDADQLYLLCGVYVGIAVSAVLLVAIFLDKLDKPSSNASGSGLSLLAATVRHWKDSRQLLLIPLTIFVGMEQAFMTGDFTKAFVTCSLGIHHVGFVMICHGVADALASVACVPVGRKLGRLPLFLFAACTNAALVTVMYFWQPNPDQSPVFFVIAGLWGMADGVWHTQVNAFYGVTFSNHREAAFSNYRLWESLGFILSFAWSNFLGIQTKLYILIGLLTAGITGYLAAETLVRRKAKAECS